MFEELDRQSIRDAIWDLGYDMVKFRDISINNTKEHDSWLIRASGSIKSAMPVTRDESGKVIPLSQRFNGQSDSILYAARRADTGTMDFFGNLFDTSERPVVVVTPREEAQAESAPAEPKAERKIIVR